MTSSGLPDSRILFDWHQRFPDRLHLWAGQLRYWTTELPLQAESTDRPLAAWVAKATACGLTAAVEVSRKLGLPEAAVRLAQRPSRRTFAFLDLPGGVQMVSLTPGESWTSPLSISAADVPPAILRPPGINALPLSDDWRTVPFVGAATIVVVAVQRETGIEVYVASPGWIISPEPTWRLPADAIVPEARAKIESELLPGEQWMWLGDGTLREAVLLRPQ